MNYEEQLNTIAHLQLANELIEKLKKDKANLMKHTKGDYKPFAHEWETEMMKIRKPDLVELLKKAYLKNMKAPEMYEALKEFEIVYSKFGIGGLGKDRYDSLKDKINSLLKEMKS